MFLSDSNMTLRRIEMTLTSWRKIGIQCNSDSGQRAHFSYSKPCVKRPLSKRQKIGFQYHLSLNAGQKYCSMLQGEHSAILSTFIKLPVVIKIFVLSNYFWSGRLTQVLLCIFIINASTM